MGLLTAKHTKLRGATHDYSLPMHDIRVKDVADTLNLALQETLHCYDQVHVVHKPHLLSDDNSGYVSEALAEWLGILLK